MRVFTLFLVLLAPVAALAQTTPAAPSPAASSPSVETRPMLATRPTGDDIVKFYPPLAHMYEIAGDALITCGVRPNGQGHDCKAIGESPPGLGFGKAAEKLVSNFRFTPATVNGVAVDRPWNSHIAFKLDEDPPAAPRDDTPSPEIMKLAEQYLRADDIMPNPVAGMAGTIARKDCAANGGGNCDVFAKAADAAAAEEVVRLQTAVTAWVATTYTEAELRTLVSSPASHDPALIDKAAELARVLPEIEARASRDHHVLIRKHYCEIVGCPSLTAAASKPTS